VSERTDSIVKTPRHKQGPPVQARMEGVHSTTTGVRKKSPYWRSAAVKEEDRLAPKYKEGVKEICTNNKGRRREADEEKGTHTTIGSMAKAGRIKYYLKRTGTSVRCVRRAP